MPLSYHNDEPVLCDQLERLELVREVGNAIANCRPPHVFGVHGDWVRPVSCTNCTIIWRPIVRSRRSSSWIRSRDWSHSLTNA